VRNGVFEIFGDKGFQEGNHWGVPSGFGIPVLVAPAPIKSDIERVIDEDRDAGREELIDYVVVTPFVAICLFLEGALTVDHLRNAVETPETVTVTLQFEGANREVVIDPQSPYPFVTIDKNGEVV
jgi:hypothetical protein